MGYDVSYYLKILTKISEEKKKQIDEYIINYFNETGDWSGGNLKFNPIYGENAGYQMKWYQCQRDMHKISNIFCEIKFLLYCLGEDDEKWYYIFENGETIKSEDIKRYVKFMNSKGENVICEEDNKTILEEL